MKTFEYPLYISSIVVPSFKILRRAFLYVGTNSTVQKYFENTYTNKRRVRVHLMLIETVFHCLKFWRFLVLPPIASNKKYLTNIGVSQ